MTGWHRNADGLPTAAGSYRLAIHLPQGAPLPPRLAARVGLGGLMPGWVVYAGSARGPGGPRARVRRHLRRDKTLRWHVDWLTTAPGATIWVQDGRSANECALTDAALRLAGACCPVPGFGSSDCDRCPAHLVALASCPLTDLAATPV